MHDQAMEKMLKKLDMNKADFQVGLMNSAIKCSNAHDTTAIQYIHGKHPP